jgi:hypothetical protein
MKARYYGICPLAPGSSILLERWFASTDRLVLLKFNCGAVSWTGPEFPRDFLAKGTSMQILEGNRMFTVKATLVDGVMNHTDFELEESS